MPDAQWHFAAGSGATIGVFGVGPADALAAALVRTVPAEEAATKSPLNDDSQALAAADEAIHWGSAVHTFPLLVPLAAATQWRAAIVEGLVVSVGGLDPALSKVRCSGLHWSFLHLLPFAYCLSSFADGASESPPCFFMKSGSIALGQGCFGGVNTTICSFRPRTRAWHEPGQREG